MKGMLLSPRAGLSLRSKSRRRIFHPSFVPEVAAGYFWEAGNTTGFGTTGFKVLEGNGHSTFDLIQATVANQPTLLTENGGAQFRMRPTTDGAPAFAVTSGSVARGWTSATGIMGWFRIPDAAGVLPASGTVLMQHSGGSGFRGINALANINSSTQVLSNALSGTGSDSNAVRAASPFGGASWVWVEMFYDPAFVLGGSVAADRLKWFVNLTLTPNILPTGTVPASLFNATTPLAVGCFTTQAPFCTTDWASCYYPNGIPSLANRVQLANRANPTGILLTA
jgi:hypothetical protein